jgi:hypothetical protein
MMTVDWSNWLNLSPAQHDALWRRSREIIKAESDRAKATNYRAMEAAMRGVSA